MQLLCPFHVVYVLPGCRCSPLRPFCCSERRRRRCARCAQPGATARLEAARAAGVLSVSGGQDLLDAYDLIAETRLNHQVKQIRNGDKPDNYLAPSELSDFERSHLRDAFVVVKTMQSAVGHGKGMLG